jgi:hypothetical protein
MICMPISAQADTPASDHEKKPINILLPCGKVLTTVNVDDSDTGAIVRATIASQVEETQRISALLVGDHEVADSDKVLQLELGANLALTALLASRYLRFESIGAQIQIQINQNGDDVKASRIGPQLLVKNVNEVTVSISEVGSQFESAPLTLAPGEQLHLEVSSDHKGRECLRTGPWWTNCLFAPARRDWVLNVRSHDSEIADEQWLVKVDDRDFDGTPAELVARDVTKPSLDVPKTRVVMGGGIMPFGGAPCAAKPFCANS